MKVKRIIAGLAIAGALFTGYTATQQPVVAKPLTAVSALTVVELPMSKYPETGKHIKDAIASGKTNICTIDRGGAAGRRKLSLANVPVKSGYDRDEFPMAMCKEGGTGADIRYISPSDNRGAGSYISNKVSDLPDGTQVKIVVK